VEQLCPFPYDLVQRELKRYPSTSFQNGLLKTILFLIFVTLKLECLLLLLVCEFFLFVTSQLDSQIYLSHDCCISYFTLYFIVFLLDAEVVWCQEEPMNMGGYTYILPRLITSMKAVGRGGYEDVKYVGRAPSAATATGFLKVHLKEQAELVQKAIQREPISFPY